MRAVLGTVCALFAGTRFAGAQLYAAPAVGPVVATTTWQSVAIDLSGMPAGVVAKGMSLTLNWGLSTGNAASTSARYFLASAPAAGGPPSAPAVIYAMPTVSVWTQGARSDTLPTALRAGATFSGPLQSLPGFTQLHLGYRQAIGTAQWSNMVLTLTAVGAPVTNEMPGGAKEIVCVPGTTVISEATALAQAATLVMDEPMPSCGNLPSRVVWYAINVPVSGQYVISACAADVPSVQLSSAIVAAFEFSGNSWTELACNAGACTAGSIRRGKLTLPLLAGQRVYIATGIERLDTTGAVGTDPQSRIMLAVTAPEGVPVGAERCQPADIAYGDGEPLPPWGQLGGFNPVGPDGGDFDCFFNYYFAAAPDNGVCDIAYGDGEPLPPFGLAGGFNPGVDGGDFDCFFNFYFVGCP